MGAGFQFINKINRYEKGSMVRALLAVALIVCVTGCSKVDRLEYKFRTECTGDITVRCRSMGIDLTKAKEEVILALVEQHRKEYIQCKGQPAYNEAIDLMKKRIDFVDSLRPGFFMRTFFSSREIEAPSDDFPGDGRLKELLTDTCQANANASPQLKSQEPIGNQSPAQSTANTGDSSPTAAPTVVSNGASSTSQVEQCVDKKTSEYRKQVGEEEVITNDMLEEWRTQCAGR